MALLTEPCSAQESEALKAAKAIASRAPDDVALRGLVADLHAVEQLQLTTTEAWVAAALQIYAHVEMDPGPHFAFFPAPPSGFIFVNGASRAQAFRSFPTKAAAVTDLLCRLASVPR